MEKPIKQNLNHMMIKKQKIIPAILILALVLLHGKEVKFDADNDGFIDKISYKIKSLQDYPNLNEPTISIDIKTKHKEFVFDTYYSVHPDISNCLNIKGCIKISQIRGGTGLNLQEYYRFNKVRQHWFLYKSKKDGNIKYFDESMRIDNTFFPRGDLSYVLKSSKKKDIKFLNSLNGFCFDYYLKNYPINENLTQYNDIAYYLQKAGANEEAVYLLEKIIKKFPNRTVAYINLGDAYWKMGEKEKAKKAYTTYIEQMCNKGLQKKIPHEVLKRVERKDVCQ